MNRTFKRLFLAMTMLVCLLAPATKLLAASEQPESEAKAPLLPNPTSSQTIISAVWVVIIFIILLMVLYPTAWKNVLAGLKARENRIRKDISDAEEARVKAEATLRDYTARLTAAEQQVRDIIAKGAVEAEKIATSIKMSAQKEAEQAKERAMQEIEAAKKTALTEIYEQTAALSTSIAEKIIRRNLNPNDQRDLVQQSLDQLQTVSQN